MSDHVSQPYLPQRAARFEEIEGRRGRIALTCWGPPSDSPIYLLHGYMDCAATWQLLVDQLPADWSFTALDWAGYGRSAHHGTGYWLPGYLDELEQVLEQRSPATPVRVMGHSMGGTIGAFYAGVRPERVRWLVDLEGLGPPRSTPAETPPRIRGWLDALRGAPVRTRRYNSFDDLTTALCKRHPHLSESHAAFLARCWATESDDGVRMNADPSHEWPTPIRYTQEDLHGCLACITAPLLLLTCSDSLHVKRVGGAAQLALWRQSVPQLQTGEVPDSGHMLHHERPAVVAGLIQQFVANLR